MSRFGSYEVFQKIDRTRLILALYWLLVLPFFASCQEQPINSANEFEILYFLNESVMPFNVPKESITITRIAYRDYDLGVVEIGDGNPGYISSYKYIYVNGKLYSIYLIEENKEKVIRYETQLTDIEYQKEGVIMTSHFRNGGTRVDEYAKSNGQLEVINGRDSGLLTAFIKLNGDDILYWDSIKYHKAKPDLPGIKVQFIKNNIVVTRMRKDGMLVYKKHFIDGILMKIEYAGGVYDEYSVSSGIGKLLRKKASGEIENSATLERRLDEEKRLIYERIVYMDGSGSVVTYLYE